MTYSASINIGYWSLQYSAQEDDEAIYRNAIESRPEPLERARALWDWKDLSRGTDVERVTAVLSNDELSNLTNCAPSDAVATLSDRLIDRGALATQTVVTPAFLLHLADSSPQSYSVQFPIFDARCWVAYVYLTRDRDEEQSLPAGATTSPSRFGRFSNFFQETIPQSMSGRQYEQALFRFGAYISSIPANTVDEIDTYLHDLESAITKSQNSNGFALVCTNDSDASPK